MSATHPGLLAAVGLASATAAVWTPRLADHLTRTPHAVNTAVGGPWRRSLTAAGVAGLTGTVLVWRLPTTPVPAACLLAAWLLFLQAGLLLTIADLETRRLPTSAIAATAAAASVLLLIGAAAGHDPGPILAALTGAALVGGTYLALAVLTPAGPGMGDVRLAALTGGLAAATGWNTLLLTAMLPYLLGLPSAIVQYRRGGGNRHIPFGPFLAAGAVTAVIITG
ncbi:prepilin peptidase [Dactylosporangium vinaceum]|uniref:Prepilin type IV endopeptidase peptidase domain-containing protein n=1 Tax=Dactylosporangium vinaceum TaxID=53362 RepID=A0ABV5M2E3_9ACTN|nr:A24 family peptidase [Dactylosporangium vinaceum]UAB96256.1 prepilin peptidase [Dactylosporangium vinaceum]